MIGWECPRCHRCFAPQIIQCFSCVPGAVTNCIHEWDYTLTAPACRKCCALAPRYLPQVTIGWHQDGGEMSFTERGKA